LIKIIQFSRSLQHLDLSGLILGDKIFPIIEKIRESKSIVSVHLNDNQFSIAQKDKILEIMGI